MPPLPEFSTAPWYADPTDHRCPNDATVESVEISGPAEGSRNPATDPAITLKLLGAHQDGWIVLHYSGVRGHNLASYHCDQGIGQWRRDEFSVLEPNLIRHRITWWSEASGTTQWVIEAGEVSYDWQPKRA